MASQMIDDQVYAFPLYVIGLPNPRPLRFRLSQRLQEADGHIPATLRQASLDILGLNGEAPVLGKLSYVSDPQQAGFEPVELRNPWIAEPQVG